MEPIIKINGTEYKFSPNFYALYRHGSQWRESASITNTELRSIYRKQQEDIENAFASKQHDD